MNVCRGAVYLFYMDNPWIYRRALIPRALFQEDGVDSKFSLLPVTHVTQSRLGCVGTFSLLVAGTSILRS
jgi:hypothetical protein